MAGIKSAIFIFEKGVDLKLVLNSVIRGLVQVLFFYLLTT